MLAPVLLNSRLALDEPGAPGAPSEAGGGQTGTSVLERTETSPDFAEPGDHERFAHYVDKNKQMESALSGAPVVALCGKVWVPTRDPQKFPVCPMCQEILDLLFPPKNND